MNHIQLVADSATLNVGFANAFPGILGTSLFDPPGLPLFQAEARFPLRTLTVPVYANAH